jgi:uncharacterized protein YndB with AHSA1/START domain
MRFVEVKVSRFIRGTAEEVFDVWFDPESPGGPWYGAKKAILNLAVDGMFFFGVAEPAMRAHMGELPVVERPEGMLGHFGRFTVVERHRVVEHTWMSEHTYGIETTVTVTFEPMKDGTQLTIVHRGVPDDERGRRHERGWNFLTSRLERYFEAKS